jgi:hypothetical protein
MSPSTISNQESGNAGICRGARGEQYTLSLGIIDRPNDAPGSCRAVADVTAKEAAESSSLGDYRLRDQHKGEQEEAESAHRCLRGA